MMPLTDEDPELRGIQLEGQLYRATRVAEFARGRLARLSAQAAACASAAMTVCRATPSDAAFLAWTNAVELQRAVECSVETVDRLLAPMVVEVGAHEVRH